jgi:CDP-diacylglycerol--glycerol-3-phosphate 3-phosphatidyltransferase
MREREMNLPNSITLGRIVLVPALVILLLTDPRDLQLFGLGKDMLAVLVFGFAAATDWLDGYLARRRQQITSLGQWMDPLADKLLVASGLISLLQMGRAPAWMVTAILGREVMVTMLRWIAHARGNALPASPLGKFKFVTQVAAILLLMSTGDPGHVASLAGRATLWIATVAAVVSALDYGRRFAIMGTASATSVLRNAR